MYNVASSMLHLLNEAPPMLRQKGLVCEDRTRWREAFTTWLMVYVLPCYPERVGLPEGPNDPVDQAR